MEFRYYQNDAIDSIFAYFTTNSGNPVVAMPTGTGKSVVLGGFVQRVFKHYPGQRVLMLTHVKELIAQNFGKLLDIWPTAPAAVYSAGLKKRNIAPITYAGIGSVVRSVQLFGHIDLVLIDECHLVSNDTATMYQKTISALLRVNPHLKVIGFSATPWRLGVGKITEGGLFTDLCIDLTSRQKFLQLVQEGYLAPLVTKKTNTQLDVTGVHIHGGEFVQSELQAAVDRDTVSLYAMEELTKLAACANRKSWIVFTTGIEHTENVTKILVEKYGVNARAVHSKQDDSVRDKNILDFKNERVTCLVNANMLTTGHDFPQLDLIGVLCPTASPVRWVQMLGRGTRPCVGKTDCLVADFAGNTERLGPINDPVLPRKKGDKTGPAPVRLCEVCDTYSHASARVCECCGTEFPRHVRFSNVSSEKDVMVGELPVVTEFRVDRVTYARHVKDGRPDTLKVSYYCGLRLFQEWVCFEHSGFALHKAHAWWDERCALERPPTTDIALANVKALRTPASIKVWVNKKYPEIMTYGF